MIKIDWTCKRQKFTALNQAPRNEENSNGGGGMGGGGGLPILKYCRSPWLPDEWNF